MVEGGPTGSQGQTTAVADDATTSPGDDSPTDGTSSTGDGEVNPVQSPCAEVLGNPGLVACWDFDDVEGSVVHDRTDNGHDLVFDAAVAVRADGFWGNALDAGPEQTGTATGFATGNLRAVEIWFRVDDAGAWGAEQLMLMLRGPNGETVAGVGFDEFTQIHRVFWPLAGAAAAVGVDDLGSELCAVSSYEGSPRTVAYVEAYGNGGLNGAPGLPFSFPPRGVPLELTLTTGWDGIIDGVRVWSTADFSRCDPTPP